MLGRLVKANGNEDLWGVPLVRVYLGFYEVLRERGMAVKPHGMAER